MKKVILAIMVVAFLASNAMAVMTVDVIRKSGYYGYNGGGEFTLTQKTGSDPIPGYTGPWQTFCVERNEYVMPPKTANFTIETYAVEGGKGGQEPVGSNMDPLNARTAFLYQKFLDGSLAAYGYNYTPGTGRSNSANSFQNVVWFIEGELVTTQEQSWYNNDAQAKAWFVLADNAVNSGAWTGIGGIRVANLYTYDSNGHVQYHQSQLIRVPAPGAILLGSIGIGLVGWLRRRHAM